MVHGGAGMLVQVADGNGGHDGLEVGDCQGKVRTRVDMQTCPFTEL